MESAIITTLTLNILGKCGKMNYLTYNDLSTALSN